MRKFFKGFYYAAHGWRVGASERNMRFHLAAAALVLFFGAYFKLNQIEWIGIVVAIGLVIAAELFNTAIENLTKTIRNKGILTYDDCKLPLDLAAGGVLICAVTSAIIGIVIFSPHIILLLSYP